MEVHPSEDGEVPRRERVGEEGQGEISSELGWEEQGSPEWGLTDEDSMSASEGEAALGDRPSGIPFYLVFFLAIPVVLALTCSTTDTDVQVRLTEDGNYTIDDGASVPKT